MIPTPSVTLQVERTVEPSSIHRRHAATVFLTDVQPDGTGGFLAGALLPDKHDYYAAHTAPANRRLDPMLLFEACRQAHNYLAHTYFNVESDAAFILNDCSLKVTPDAYTLLPASGPGLLTMTLPEPPPQRTGRRTRGLAPAFTLAIGGTPIGQASMTVAYASARAYPTLRTRHRGSPTITSADLPPTDRAGAAAPEVVGRTEGADVLLADVEGASARLLVPAEHLGLFDHPLDHIPGTLLVEAARQLAVAISPHPRTAVMTAMTATFHTYAELDAPVELTATALNGQAVVTAVQADTTVATITVAVHSNRQS